MAFSMPDRRWFAACLLSLLVAGTAAGAEIASLAVEVDGNLARLDLVLDGGFDAAFVERLESGLPTGLIYRFELLQDRRWFDRELAAGALQVVAMYDAATRGYLINYKLDGKLIESRMVRELSEVEAAMTEIEDLPVFRLDDYPRAWRLLVRARAVVGSRTVLFFVPARAITPWKPSRKFRTLNQIPSPG